MGTRSVIAIAGEDGVKAIYCHWDGYIENNGVILQENYTDRSKVEQLIELGDLSGLYDTVEDCVAYHRDRGESREQTEARTYPGYYEMLDAEFENSDREYVYIFMRNDKWSVIDYQTMRDEGPQELSEAVAKIKRQQMRSV